MNVFSTVIKSRVFDGKGRNVSFEVELFDREDGLYWVSVQMVKNSKQFGSQQRAISFDNQVSASRHGYKIAKERLQNLMSNTVWMESNKAEIR